MKDSNCIFCKIANGQIPSYTLYEDDDFKVIFDIAPATKGHAIVIPKEHYKNLFELNDDIASKALVVAKKVASKLREHLNCDGFNLLQNNEEIAGQTVFHFHIHLIPRYTDDTVSFKTNPGSVDADFAKELSDKIRESF